jgi:pimeloyl-ACP methyl ester carboxylesterase
MLKKIFLGLFALAMILLVVYMLGPKLHHTPVTIQPASVPIDPEELENYLSQREDTIKGLKPGNEAYIQWADSTQKIKTPYSIIYLHGFGGAGMEGDPVHRFLGEHFGANLFVTRLPEHGIRRANGMEYMSAQALADAAGEAFQIGKTLGDSVIVVGTSMGGSLGILLASQFPDVHSLILYSPAIRDNGERLSALFQPWMGTIMEMTLMENQVIHQKREGEKAIYWSEDYHLNGYKSLAGILYTEMNENTFKKIKQPVFLGYYYKSPKEQDFVVSVPKMQEMFKQLGTAENLKKEVAFPKSGDHVIASAITSKDWEGVLFSTIEFLENVAKVPPRSQYVQKIDELTAAKEIITGVK